MKEKKSQTTTTFTAAELADIFGRNVQTWKRWARTYFGIDQAAGRGQGAVRKFTREEAFLLWLSGRLTSMSGLSSDEVSEVFTYLKPWLKKREYFPIERGWQKHIKLKVSKIEKVESWTFYISRGIDKSLRLSARGGIEPAKWETMDDLIRKVKGMPIITDIYCLEAIKIPQNFTASVTILLEIDDLVWLFCNKVGV